MLNPSLLENLREKGNTYLFDHKFCNFAREVLRLPWSWFDFQGRPTTCSLWSGKLAGCQRSKGDAGQCSPSDRNSTVLMMECVEGEEHAYFWLNLGFGFSSSLCRSSVMELLWLPILDGFFSLGFVLSGVLVPFCVFVSLFSSCSVCSLRLLCLFSLPLCLFLLSRALRWTPVLNSVLLLLLNARAVPVSLKKHIARYTTSYHSLPKHYS
jgi:hypothetical protein